MAVVALSQGVRGVIDRDSEAGSWDKALRAPCRSRIVTEYPGADTHSPSAGNCGAAESDLAAPPLSDDNLLHSDGPTP